MRSFNIDVEADSAAEICISIFIFNRVRFGSVSFLCAIGIIGAKTFT